MEYKVLVPTLGESVVEGTIVKWLKEVGDKIQIDDPLVEIMTDKINVEIPSPREGVMKKHIVGVDTLVKVGQVIAVMDVSDKKVDATTPRSEAEPEVETAEKPKTVKLPEHTVAHEELKQMGLHADEEAIEGGIKAVKSSPVVRKLAREHFIDLRLLKGSGKGDRVSKEDVINYINMRHSADKQKPDLFKAAGQMEEVIPITGVRKIISEHMVKSAFTIPHVTTFDECDFYELKKWRKTHVDKIEKQYGVRITFLPFIAKAIIFAAKDFPWINSTFENDNLTVKKYFNIGMAVARDNSLIVPVVKNCEQKTILEIGREMRDLADKANADTLSIDQISGGTFSITNAGGMGALGSTPIIAKPQVAILGVHKIVDKPVVKDGEIVIRPIMNFGLSFDHRVVDGGYAVQFLRRMIEYLEDPQGWLMGVV